jgi:hypothetical protein
MGLDTWLILSVMADVDTAALFDQGHETEQKA